MATVKVTCCPEASLALITVPADKGTVGSSGDDASRIVAMPLAWTVYVPPEPVNDQSVNGRSETILSSTGRMPILACTPPGEEMRTLPVPSGLKPSETTE